MKITALFFGVFAGCLSCIPAHAADYLWNGRKRLLDGFRSVAAG